MKVVIVAYCFGDPGQHALIGVYKRGLRVALELCNSGHEVVMFCAGHSSYQDELTVLAKERICFIDFPVDMSVEEHDDNNKKLLLNLINDLSPDMVVIGEAPLAGTLLEYTLCAVELEIPVVFVDNAYYSGFADYFCEIYGPMADGIILTGLSSFHLNSPPDYLCQVPPFIRASPEKARNILNDNFGLNISKLVTVLAYDDRVEMLAESLLLKLNDPSLHVLFISQNPKKCKSRIRKLSVVYKDRILVVAPPIDDILFGFLELSKLAVGKCAFMQISECFALQTPFIGFYYEGFFNIDSLPDECLEFVQATSNTDADNATVATAAKFLNINHAEMKKVHNGGIGALEESVLYLESFIHSGRKSTNGVCDNPDFTTKHVVNTVKSLYPFHSVNIYLLRSMLIRKLQERDIYVIVCGFIIDGEKIFYRFWGSIFKSKEEAVESFRNACMPGSNRHPLYFSNDDKIVIEKYSGQKGLPPCICV